MRARIALAIVLLTPFFLSLLKPLASASPDDKKSPTTSFQLVSKTKLEVKEFSGEFERWVKSRVLESAGTVAFRWSTNEPGVASATYEVTDTPGGFGVALASQTPNIVATGTAGPVPAKGLFTRFAINFATFVSKTPPASPKRYYVRVATRNALNQAVGKPSSQVTIPYQDTTKQPITDFSGIPDQYKPPKPMRIEAKLEDFIVKSPNEGERSDEPYLFVAVVYFDGSTIKPWDLARSSVRIDSPYKTHGNIMGAYAEADGDIPSPATGVSYQVPKSTGDFVKDILPIDGLDRHPKIQAEILAIPDAKQRAQAQIKARAALNGLSKDLSMVAVIVAALEEDNTPTNAIQAGRRAFEEGLRDELNAFVRSLNNLPLSELQKFATDPKAFGQTIVDQIKDRIKDKAIAAAEKWVKQNTPLEFTGILAVNAKAGKDDFIGVEAQFFSFREIEKASQKGIPFTLNFNDDGSYTIKGKIRWRCITLQDQKRDPWALSYGPLCP